MLDQLLIARRTSVPSVTINTLDPEASIEAIAQSAVGKSLEPGKESNPIPMIKWDRVRGYMSVHQTPEKLASAIAGGDPAVMTSEPLQALTAAVKLPPDGILFMINMHLFWNDHEVLQAICNLRGLFKKNGRTLINLVQDESLPREIGMDTLLIDQPLPDSKSLEKVVRTQYKNAKLAPPTPEVIRASTDALLGLAEFPAEQAVAMSLTEEGVDLPSLWTRKRQMIEQTPGLSVWSGDETFESIGGCANIKNFLTAVKNGQDPPRACWYIDEIEKSIGTGMDTSGVSQSMLGTLLTYMQDHDVLGVIAVGPPGACKSMMAKAFGNEAKIPTIVFDLSGMKGSLVGESEAKVRRGLKVVSAVSQGRSICIATCNSIGVLPPELRRRFMATFFFDLPSDQERDVIWNLYTKKFGIKDKLRPDDEGWTGAEIRQCVMNAWRFKLTLQQAAAYVVPVAISAADTIDALRRSASGRFISASEPGYYNYKTIGASEEAITRLLRFNNREKPELS